MKVKPVTSMFFMMNKSFKNIFVSRLYTRKINTANKRYIIIFAPERYKSICFLTSLRLMIKLKEEVIKIVIP